MKYTPGPWKVSRCWSQTCGDNYVIDNESGDEAEMQANARLIATAPELLEALVELAAQYSGMCQEFDWTPCNCGEVIGTCAHCRAVSAVRKAKGDL